MKVVLLIAGALLLSSCQKEEDTPQPQIVEIIDVDPDCMCGEIVNQLQDVYTIDVANNCSGNIKRFTAEYIGQLMSGVFCDKTGQSW